LALSVSLISDWKIIDNSDDNGLILGNQRFGIDSQLGYENGRGLDLGSFLNVCIRTVNVLIEACLQ